MHLPGFQAERSLYNSSVLYATRGIRFRSGRPRIEPAAFIIPKEHYPCPIGSSEVCELVCGPGGECEPVCRCIF
jgi:hypothetical protein